MKTEEEKTKQCTQKLTLTVQCELKWHQGSKFNIQLKPPLWRKKCVEIYREMIRNYWWADMKRKGTNTWLTIRWKLVLFKDGDAKDVLVDVFDVKLTVEVPLGVHGVVDRSGRKDLSSHCHLTVGVTFTWRDEKRRMKEQVEGKEKRVEMRLKKKRKRRENRQRHLVTWVHPCSPLGLAALSSVASKMVTRSLPIPLAFTVRAVYTHTHTHSLINPEISLY